MRARRKGKFIKLDVFACIALMPDNGIKTMADKGIRVMFDTNELTGNEFQSLFAMKGKAGKLIFSSEDYKLTPDDLVVPDISKDFKEEKTPSQRLRAVLYRLWQQSEQGLDFEVYYRSKMDNFINQLKDKLS